jgi:hypothetical protein
MAVNIPNGHEIFQHLPLKDPTKFTQTGIFGSKINRLATLAESATANAGRKQT